MDRLDYFKANMLPFAALLGIEFVAVDKAKVVGELTVRQDLCTVLS